MAILDILSLAYLNYYLSFDFCAHFCLSVCLSAKKTLSNGCTLSKNVSIKRQVVTFLKRIKMAF